MRKFVCIIFLSSASFISPSQLVDVIHEIYFASGGIGDIPTGYTTCRIYARLADPTDRISAVFGSNSPSPIHHLKIQSSAVANAIYNSAIAGTLGTNSNCAFWGFFPSHALRFLCDIPSCGYSNRYLSAMFSNRYHFHYFQSIKHDSGNF
ncbi:MAG: hypothetical protein SH856_05500 [Flavobacteriales bacterium]|nr:hypothetical protein [Flavobacteriales bacterium]